MYIILGCLIDGISMIVLTTVIVLPMIKQAGLDLVWFGIFLVIHVEMAQITPPVGFNLFVLQNMSGQDTLHGRARGVAVLPAADRRGFHHHRISPDRAGPAAPCISARVAGAKRPYSCRPLCC